ncbi:DUF1289 domain-containing protein [Methylogaea oryzae]|uniref:DUF1289 domain-containing protein n=1 Tax=Methylogaea oryzae TaxID=1295382 RepID=A0A8D5AIW8_9GAMM|nr:DUF1289 domain-containing protein [Methylogaea oryzae]BBL71786.1 hypothetical protein MoryE10_23920 [Methylogaea oryzae]
MHTPTQRVPSPCVRNCCLDSTDICLGCFRALAEITGWQEADDDVRRDILRKAEQRRRARSRDAAPPWGDSA